jgi:(2R)-3-sulfolactate dehydrogenase (NADP+)
MAYVELNDIEAASRAALLEHGAGEPAASQVATAIRVAESYGNRICGLYYLESYCKQLQTGRIDGKAEPKVSADRPGAVRVDAMLGFAQTAFAAGLDTALQAARENGICGYSIEHAHTCTSLGFYTEQLAMAGMIGIGVTNASPRVAPPGGSKPVLGTNPIAMAVPDGSGGIAFQFDFSTSAVALGKITMAAAAGEEIPLGWAVDADGNPTTDPDAALKGSLVSAGGYKGYGIGLMVEVLASALTGSRASVDVPPLKTPYGVPHDLGQFYLIIDPGAYAADGFHRAVADLGAVVASQPGARLPGTSRPTTTEIEVDEALWSSVIDLAQGPS